MRCRDARVARQFCEKHGVNIFHRKGSKAFFVLEKEFETIYEQTLLNGNGVSMYEYQKLIVEDETNCPAAPAHRGKNTLTMKKVDNGNKLYGKHGNEFLERLAAKLSEQNR